MTPVVIDDHLLRDVLTGHRPLDLGGVATSLATTGLWLFRLSSALASPSTVGKLSRPVAALPEGKQARFRVQLIELPGTIELLMFRKLAWQMAEIQHRHRVAGIQLSAATAEALATAQVLNGAIAVSRLDVGPGLQAAAARDGIPFHVL
jgi:hypothetical protein